MSVTPLDILHKDFRRSLRGYRERDVQEFLRQMAEALEQALTTSAELREKTQSLERRLLHYEKIEETMQNALVLAQKSAEDTRRGSQKQAEVILADAEQKRQQVLGDARNRGAASKRRCGCLRSGRPCGGGAARGRLAPQRSAPGLLRGSLQCRMFFMFTPV